MNFVYSRCFFWWNLIRLLTETIHQREEMFWINYFFSWCHIKCSEIGVMLIFSGRSLIVQIYKKKKKKKKKKKASLIYTCFFVSLCGSVTQIVINLYIFLWSHWILFLPIDFKPVVRLGIKTITGVLKVSAYIITNYHSLSW